MTASLGRGFQSGLPLCLPSCTHPGEAWTHDTQQRNGPGPGDLCAWPAWKQGGAEGTAEAVLPVNAAWQWKSELKARTFMFARRLEWKGCLPTAKVTCNTFE